MRCLKAGNKSFVVRNNAVRAIKGAQRAGVRARGGGNKGFVGVNGGIVAGGRAGGRAGRRSKSTNALRERDCID